MSTLSYDATGAAQPEAVMEVPGADAVRVKAVHPRPPISGWGEQDWRRELRELPGPSADGMPRILAGDFNGTLDHREIRRVLDRGYYDALIEEYATRGGVRKDLVRAVIQVESAFNPRAVSNKGAIGLMQLMPATARQLGVSNAFDPAQNIRGGVAYHSPSPLR